MRPKFQKQSALKLAGRIIPRSGGYKTSQLAAESVSKACFGVHTRDSVPEGQDEPIKNFIPFSQNIFL